MNRHEIKCIIKSKKLAPHEQIEFVGGLNRDGSRWRISQVRAIEGIESGLWEFFVSNNVSIVDVVIANHNGNKYLKTKNDGIESNNLLSLPECPY